MSGVFISYARSTAAQAQAVAEALRGLGYGVWSDDELPAHRNYADVIEERLKAAKAVVVIWSVEAVKSQWVRAEADLAREAGTLVQLSLDGAVPPMPFNQIQCADLAGWAGDLEAPGWRKVVSSISDLAGGAVAPAPASSDAPPPLPTKPSIAVMPFANLSGDPEQDYFADGMVEEITTALSRFKSIFVIGSGSTLTFKGKAASPQEVGGALGVRYVLEGSVRQAGGRVRIAVKLTDAADGAQIWADRFEDTLEDVFALQDRVALGAAAVIEPAIVAAEMRRVSMRPTENLGSYDLYLRALPLMQSFRPDKERAAIVLLERAIALDPDFGRALAVAAWCYAFFIIFGGSLDPERDRSRALQLARRAVAAGGDDAQALAYAANVLNNLEAKPDAALALIERAMALNPGAEVVWATAGIIYLAAGEPERAIEHLETAMRLDPLSPQRAGMRMFIGAGLGMLGRLDEAYAVLSEIVHLSPSAVAPAALASVCGQLGRIDEAREALALYAKRSSLPIEERTFGRPEHRQRFLNGIALARGETPAGDPPS
jgi:adenylate cyclase